MALLLYFMYFLLYTMQTASDIVIFQIINNELCVLAVQRATPPFEGWRCLPGGMIKEDETALQAAIRVLHKETWIRNHYLEEFGTFSDVKRDPRGRVISLAFFAILTSGSVLTPWVTQKSVMFFPLKQIPKLVFDHHEVLKIAYQKLREKALNGDILPYFLPKYFTLWQLQKVYELLLWTKTDKRNFRKEIGKKYALKSTGKKEFNVPHRPAILYKFS